MHHVVAFVTTRTFVRCYYSIYSLRLAPEIRIIMYSHQLHRYIAIFSHILSLSHHVTLADNHEDVSLYQSTKMLTFTIVLECLFGIGVVPETLFGVFERVLEGVLSPPVNFPGTKFARAKKASAEIEKVVVGEIRRKGEDMEGGGEEEDGKLFSKLVAASIRGEITEEEVVDNVVLLVFAAHDTTLYAITMTFKMLANHPDCYSLLLKDNAAMSSRMLILQKATTDINFEGVTIPKGWKVLWTTYGTHYDEKYFPDPMSFNPSRFEDPVQAYAFIPFGGGPRLCAGFQLAKLNILVLVHYVVTRYNWSLVYPDEPFLMDPLPFPSKWMPIKISPKSDHN
ncbi:putative protopanaxadiol 6-hydroxylase [Helianthus debilis subsp. tardiflorus]